LSAPRGETETEREEVTLETLRERLLGIRDDSTSYRFERTRIHRVIPRIRSRIKGDGPMEVNFSNRQLMVANLNTDSKLHRKSAAKVRLFLHIRK
jgi:hypothetical protein